MAPSWYLDPGWEPFCVGNELIALTVILTMKSTEFSPEAMKAAITELAQTIANQAEAIANGTLVGPQYAAVKLLKDNVDTLSHWIGDDRFIKEG